MVYTDKDIRLKMYKDVKRIITTYFSNTKYENLDKYNLDFEPSIDSSDIFFNELEVYYNIHHFLKLNNIIKDINIQISRDVVLQDIDVKNGIRGHLNFSKYIKQQYGRVSTNQFFPCKVISNSYDTIENRFVILIIKYVFNKMKSMPIDDSEFINEYINSSQFKYLKNLVKNLKNTLKLGDLSELIENSTYITRFDIVGEIEKLKKIVKIKVRRKEINPKTYGNLVTWWEEYRNYDFSKIDTLLYNEKFDDKLFEIWLIESIKSTFIKYYNFKIIDINGLWKRKKEYIYKFSIDNKIICIYYQKSKGLMWGSNLSDRPKWRIEDTNGFLGGNLDIIITCDDNIEYDPVLIDAKNINYKININKKEVTNPSVTDKIYKMVGYIDNFYKVAKNNKNAYGVIIFRNNKDEIQLEKQFISDMNDGKIHIYSLNPLYIDVENLKLICNRIAENFGILKI